MKRDLFAPFLVEGLVSEFDKSLLLLFVYETLLTMKGETVKSGVERVKKKLDFYFNIENDMTELYSLIKSLEDAYSEVYYFLGKIKSVVRYGAFDSDFDFVIRGHKYHFTDPIKGRKTVEGLRKVVEALERSIEEVGKELYENKKVQLAVQMLDPVNFDKGFFHSLSQINIGLALAYFYLSLFYSFNISIRGKMLDIKEKIERSTLLTQLFPGLIPYQYTPFSSPRSGNILLALLNDVAVLNSDLNLEIKEKIENKNVIFKIRYERVVDCRDGRLAVNVFKPLIEIKVGKLNFEVDLPITLTALISKYIKFSEVLEEIEFYVESSKFRERVKNEYLKRINAVWEKFLMMKEGIK